VLGWTCPERYLRLPPFEPATSTLTHTLTIKLIYQIDSLYDQLNYSIPFSCFVNLFFINVKIMMVRGIFISMLKYIIVLLK
jgi:hypothetical protein